MKIINLDKFRDSIIIYYKKHNAKKENWETLVNLNYS